MSHILASYILITGIEERKHATILSASRWRMTVFYSAQWKLLQQENSTCNKKLFWRDFSTNPDDTYVISTQSIWTSRQRSYIQGDKKSTPAKFPGWSITIRKCYEYCLETDTMSRVRGKCFLWDSVLSSSPDPSKVSPQSTFFPLLPLTFYYRFARVLISYKSID